MLMSTGLVPVILSLVFPSQINCQLEVIGPGKISVDGHICPVRQNESTN